MIDKIVMPIEGSLLHFRSPANAITLVRGLIAPFALWMILAGSRVSLTICLGLLILAETTDILDGIVARHTNKVSDVGKLLDPLCDSLLRIMVFLGFLCVGWMNVWMFAVILSRDILVAYIRVFAGLHNIVLAARFSGKLKAICQGTAQIAALVVFVLEKMGIGWFFSPNDWAFGLLSIATVVTAYSAIDYTAHVVRQVRTL